MYSAGPMSADKRNKLIDHILVNIPLLIYERKIHPPVHALVLVSQKATQCALKIRGNSGK